MSKKVVVSQCEKDTFELEKNLEKIANRGT